MELELKPLALPGISEERPIVIAGPCSAETEEQVMNTATALANKGIKIFRAGIWKPRSTVDRPFKLKMRNSGTPQAQCFVFLYSRVSFLIPMPTGIH